jgi:hypothetical protein
MAGITSHYEMATALSVDEVHDMLRDKLGFVTREVRHKRYRPTLYTTNDGLTIETYAEERPEFIEETFGFRPTVHVDLELARGQEPGFEEGALNRIRVVDWLLNNVEGDAVLLHNYDLSVLLRRNGKVWLREDRRFWNDEHLSLLTVPYEWRKLPEY